MPSVYLEDFCLKVSFFMMKTRINQENTRKTGDLRLLVVLLRH